MDNRGAAPGERRGGRKKGTPNKKTALVEEKLAEIGVDPLDIMARIAAGETLGGETPDIGMRKDAAKDLLQYTYPKRKAVEHSGNISLHEAMLDDLE